MQGIYALSPAGRLLGRINSNNPDQVLSVLERSLKTWAELPTSERQLPDGARFEPTHRWEQSCPTDGLVLERYARDIGDDPAAQPRRPVNRDAVWFTRDEALGWLPEQLVAGATGDVSPVMATRLARLALVDNVRGQTLPFANAEIEQASLRFTVRAIGDKGAEILFDGSTRAVAKGPWLGGDNYWKPKREWPRRMETEVKGRATYDTAQKRFVAFELIALGERQGRTTFNGRHREDRDATYRIGFLLRLAPANWRVAPTFINVYDVDWVAPPPEK